MTPGEQVALAAAIDLALYWQRRARTAELRLAHVRTILGKATLVEAAKAALSVLSLLGDDEPRRPGEVTRG